MSNKNNDGTPLVSVIVPCYNVEKYVAECLKSIVEQSYENLEIIVVNDGSTDNTEQEILPFLEDKRIKYVVQKNQGLSGARNTGLDNMKGEYVCFVDSDDFIHPDFVKILYQSLIKSDTDIALCDFHEFEDGKIFDFYEIKNAKEIIFSRDEMMQEINRNWKFCIVWNKLYKSGLFTDLKFEIGRVHEDEFIIHHLFWRTQKIAITNAQLYFYRQVQGSIMNSLYTDKKLKDAIDAYDDRLTFYKKHNLPTELVYQVKWLFLIWKKAICKNNMKSAKIYILRHPLEFLTKASGGKKEKIKIYLKFLREFFFQK